MSERSKRHRAAREAKDRKQEQQGKKVFGWVLGILIRLAVVFLIYSMMA